MHFKLWIKLLLGRVNLLLQNVDYFPGRFGGLQLCFYFINTIHNRSMITASKVLSYIFKSGIRHMPAKIHDNLTWKYDFGISLISYNISRCQVKMFCHNVCYQFWSDRPFFIW